VLLSNPANRLEDLKSAALIGCGFIGAEIARFMEEEMSQFIKLELLFDQDRAVAEALSRSLSGKPRVVDDAELIFSDPLVSLVIEAASFKAAQVYVMKALSSSKDVLTMSVGAFADEEFLRNAYAVALKNNAKIMVPSGAIGGLDWIKAASQAGLSTVSITVRKPPKALAESPYVVKNKIDLSLIKHPVQIYEGFSSEAASLFPANINVATALSLAGIGTKKTLVRVIADPSINTNIHEIQAEGAAGKITVRVENIPSPLNPKTSWVAALSAKQKLKDLVNPMSVGS
jgi:aspartate dehydrogenase